jgi:predicted  nucleic acid-binding Zn-ribbon protein
MARDTSTLLATNHQIQTIKDENAKLEDRALGLVERIGELEKEFEKMEKELARVREDYDVFAKACEAELGKAKDELAAHDQKRGEIAAGLAAEPLEMYERLIQARDGLAVCAVEGDSCVGCGGVVSPNDLMKLRNARDVIRCKSCSRILYIET